MFSGMIFRTHFAIVVRFRASAVGAAVGIVTSSVNVGRHRVDCVAQGYLRTVIHDVNFYVLVQFFVRMHLVFCYKCILMISATCSIFAYKIINFKNRLHRPSLGLKDRPCLPRDAVKMKSVVQQAIFNALFGVGKMKECNPKAGQRGLPRRSSSIVGRDKQGLKRINRP